MSALALPLVPVVFLVGEDGQVQGVSEAFRRAEETARRLVADFPHVPDARWKLAGCLASRGRMFSTLRDQPRAVGYLREARALGSALIVAVNSDRSVRVNKGPDRPVNTERERAELLLALACVDAAAIFDEETPHAIISRIQPDVLVKGADWGPDNIIGRDVVEARGGRVVRIALAPGHSTTELIDRVQRLRRARPTDPKT